MRGQGDFDNKSVSGDLEQSPYRSKKKENSPKKILGTISKTRGPGSLLGWQPSESKEASLLDVRNDSLNRKYPMVKGKLMI